MRKLMAHEGPFHLELPCGRLAETLGSTPLRLELWHGLLGKKLPLLPATVGSYPGQYGAQRLISRRQNQCEGLSFELRGLLDRRDVLTIQQDAIENTLS
jgi:hypothetical protein